MTALIVFYSRCGHFDVARKLFDDMGERDLVAWNAMMSGCVENLRNVDALSLFRSMGSGGLRPSAVTLVTLLSACREMEEIRIGQEIHCYCLRNGLFYREVHVGTALVDFYSKFDAMASRSVFNLMEFRNKITWNAILYAHVYSGDFDEVMILFVNMLEEDIDMDSVTFLAILESCADLGCLECGKQIHQLATKHGFLSDNYVANAFIVMYGKCRAVDSSYRAFEKAPSADLASWNAMLTSYRNCACFGEAFDLFKMMQENNIEQNSVTLAIMFSICDQSGRFEMGKELHAYVIKTGGYGKDPGVESALLNMYVESSSISCASTFFDRMKKPEVVSWNTLIKALMDHGYTYQAWELFHRMQDGEDKPNSFTMVSLLSGCEGSSIKVGKSIHGYIIRYGLNVNPSLCTALTDMYMNCGNEPTAVHLFWSCCDRDIVSWNAMIASYFHSGQPPKALSFFSKMHSEANPNAITIMILLLCCAKMADLPKGRSFHAYISRREMDLDGDICLANALLTMYAKCGSLEEAQKVFRNIKKKDVISWNAMIAAYGMHGRGKDALEVFYQMIRAGEKPTSVTFVSVLSSCSHSCLVEEGYKLFHSMVEDYGITPQAIHYGCMVDLLGRSGFLDDALNLVHSMTMEPDASVWRALLGACQLSSNLEMARFVAQKLNELEPLNSGNYKLLSNIYAAAGRWEDVRELKKEIKERGLQKTTGTSWMAIRNQVHSFTAGNQIPSQNDVIYEKLEGLLDDLIRNWMIS